MVSKYRVPILYKNDTFKYAGHGFQGITSHQHNLTIRDINKNDSKNELGP